MTLKLSAAAAEQLSEVESHGMHVAINFTYLSNWKGTRTYLLGIFEYDENFQDVHNYRNGLSVVKREPHLKIENSFVLFKYLTVKDILVEELCKVTLVDKILYFWSCKHSIIRKCL